MDLHVLWFLLLGALLFGYAVLDGFDFGVGMLHLFVAKTDEERRIVMNSIGPLWDGNEVWLVTFGGALFAAFPVAYASAFSGFYVPFMLLLTALIFRGVAMEFRSKRPERTWRAAFDVAFAAASFLCALLMGTAVGASLWGVPIGERGIWQGGILDMVTPYSLLVGALAVALFAMHGAIYLHLKTATVLAVKLRGRSSGPMPGRRGRPRCRSRAASACTRRAPPSSASRSRPGARRTPGPAGSTGPP